MRKLLAAVVATGLLCSAALAQQRDNPATQPQTRPAQPGQLQPGQPGRPGQPAQPGQPGQQGQAASADQQVAVGELSLDAHLLVATAALEVTLHGWDVSQSTGRRTPIPDDLATRLLPVAREVIGADDRGGRFASPRPTAPDAPSAARLLAWAGRAPDHTGSPPIGQAFVERQAT